jgi:predicted metal-dependent hydrolase
MRSGERLGKDQQIPEDLAETLKQRGISSRATREVLKWYKKKFSKKQKNRRKKCFSKNLYT